MNSLLLIFAYVTYIAVSFASDTEKVFECEDNDDCEINRFCLKQKCADPCESVCGTNATCDVINHVALCSCSRGYFWNPVVGCSKFGINDTILLLSGISEVYALDVTHSKITPVIQNISIHLSSIMAVSYHYAKKFIFYNLGGQILRDVVNTSGLPVVRGEPKTVVEGVGNVRLAVDWVHDKLYWMSNTNDNIEVSDLDGNNRTTIWKGSIDSWRYSYNIAVDPYAGYVFFTNVGVVYRMHLDGTNMTALPFNGCKKMALDIHRKKIYCISWNESIDTAIINSFDYEGECETQIPTGVEYSGNFYGMDVFRDLMFFNQYIDDQDNVWSVDLANTNSTPILIKSSEGIYGLKVYHPDVQKAP